MIIKFDPKKTPKKNPAEFFYQHSLAWIITSIIATIILAAFVDRKAALFFSSSSSFIITLAKTITDALDPIEILVIVPLFYLASLLLWKKNSFAIPCKMLVFLLPLTLLGVKLLHIVLPRTPPSLFLEKNIFTISWSHALASTSSFPSQKAAMIGAFSGLLAFLKPNKSVKYLVLALVLALADAITSASFISDVFAGSMLGFSISLYTARTWKDKKIKL